jgi:hypothetical protein
MPGDPAVGEAGLELARQGAITLVGALSTYAFIAARAGISRLYGRFGAERAQWTVMCLDTHQELMTGTEVDEHDEVREELAAGWWTSLAGLLADHPDAEHDLRQVLDEIRASLPEAQRVWVRHAIAWNAHDAV